MKNLNNINFRGLNMNVMKFIYCLIIFGLICSHIIVSVYAVECDTGTYIYVVVNKDRAIVDGASVSAAVNGIVVDTKTTNNRGEATLIIHKDEFPDDSTPVDVVITASLNDQAGSTIKKTICGTPPEPLATVIDIKFKKEDSNLSVNEEHSDYNESKEYCGDDVCNGAETYETCSQDCKEPDKSPVAPECTKDSDCRGSKICKDGKCADMPSLELKISAPPEVNEGEEFTVNAVSKGKPVSGVAVNYGGKTRYTDAEGGVTFTGVSGETSITAEKEGYTKASTSLQIKTDTADMEVDKGCKKDSDCAGGQTCKEGVCAAKTTNWQGWLIIFIVISIMILLLLWSILKKRE